MIDPKAEDSYRHGAELLTSGSARDALAFFKAAVDLAAENGEAERASARYLSYYGFCLFRTRNGYREALGYCRKAIALDDTDPDLWWNLGRVAGGVSRRGEAWRAFSHGLRLEPGHPGIRLDMRRLGERRPPVLSFLRRGHPLNIALGRFRARVQGRPSPASRKHGLSVATR